MAAPRPAFDSDKITAFPGLFRGDQGQGIAKRTGFCNVRNGAWRHRLFWVRNSQRILHEGCGREMSKLSVALPPPPGSSEAPVWTGREFRLGGTSRRVLAFDLGESGWSEELFELHQKHASGDHFIDVASRRHALQQLDRWVPARDGTVLGGGCCGGYFLRDLAAARPEAEIIGADYTLGALDYLGRRIAGIPLLQFD